MTESKETNVEHLADLIGTRYKFTPETLAVMDTIRAEIMKAAKAITAALKANPKVAVDAAHLAQGLVELRAAKDTLCHAVIEPYSRPKPESMDSE